jgi:hypothetical protein
MTVMMPSFPGRRLKVRATYAHRSIAQQVKYGLVWSRQLGPHCDAQASAQLSGVAPANVPPGCRGGVEGHYLVAGIAGVVSNNAIGFVQALL